MVALMGPLVLESFRSKLCIIVLYLLKEVSPILALYCGATIFVCA